MIKGYWRRIAVEFEGQTLKRYNDKILCDESEAINESREVMAKDTICLFTTAFKHRTYTYNTMGKRVYLSKNDMVTWITEYEPATIYWQDLQDYDAELVIQYLKQHDFINCSMVKLAE